MSRALSFLRTAAAPPAVADAIMLGAAIGAVLFAATSAFQGWLS